MLALLSIILGIAGLFVGCGDTPKTTKKPAKKIATKQPPKKLVQTADASGETATLLRDIKVCKDLFELHDMNTAYEQNEEKAAEVADALAKQRDTLFAGCELRPAIDGHLDIVSFEFKCIEGEKYRLRWYYVVKEDITLNWTLKVVLKVDSSHIGMLPEEDQELGFIHKRIYAKALEINTWKKGEHRVVSLDLNLKEIPYKMETVFYQWFPDKPLIYGEYIDHGWQAALEE